jgi:hypothetical protein
MADKPDELPRKSRKLGAKVETPEVKQRRLPADAPCKALGYAGQCLAVLDGMGQLHMLNSHMLDHKLMMFITGDVDWLYQTYPRMKNIAKRGAADEWIVTGWRTEDFYEDLYQTCIAMGRFDIAERVRGRGAYRADDGGLILHLGEQLCVLGQLTRAGVRSGFVYPAANALPGPVSVTVDPTPANRLLYRIGQSWNFQRPKLDPVLIVGMLGVCVLSGALPVRPGAALTGERGTGKSELLLFMHAVLGAWSIYSTDSTEAGMRQKLGRDALAYFLDEQESRADNTGFLQTQLYWRASYGGGVIVRGGQNHVGSEFKAISTLIIAAINLPAMDSADRSRVLIVQLRKLAEGAKVKMTDDATLPQIGAQLIRRLMDNYKRLVAEIIPAWRALLMSDGWDDRGADTYGVVLGCAWALLTDETPTDGDLATHARDLQSLMWAHAADEVPTYRRVLNRFWGWRADQYRRGEQRGLGEYAIEAAGWGRDDPAGDGDQWTPFDPDAINRSEAEAQRDAAASLDARKAAQLLKRYGIRILTAEHEGAHWQKGDRLIAFAHLCHAISEIFRGTPWAALGSGQGGWTQALLGAPTAQRWPRPVRFPFGLTRVVVMRLDVALAGMVGADETVGEAVDQWAPDPA